MTITIHDTIQQHSLLWHRLRNSCLTSSDMDKAITPKTRKPSAQIEALAMQKIALQITGNYEESGGYSYAMERGNELEPIAREVYAQSFAPVCEIGFATRDLGGGVILGASTDGLIGTDGVLEIKCPLPANHLQTILSDAPEEAHMLQAQTEMFVTGRKWCDVMFYCPDMPSLVRRVHYDETIEPLLIEAAKRFFEVRASIAKSYAAFLDSGQNIIAVQEVIEA